MKKQIAICAPVTSKSGYGAHSRDIVRAILSLNKYELKILDVRWGSCQRNALDEIKDKNIIDCFSDQLTRKPDAYIDIRIPNEFEQICDINIGITAGIETTSVSTKWIEGCNKMTSIIVPSVHSANSFLNTSYDMLDTKDNNKKIGSLKVEKPMHVIFEGADANIYKPLKVNEMDTNILKLLNDTISEQFCFLFVGQWGKGNMGEDRKDIGTLIKTFIETFANRSKQPALILKTNGAGYSCGEESNIINNINLIKAMFPDTVKMPNIYLLHGDLTDDEMNSLYNHPKVKAMVSFTHGEGYGRPLLEATMVGLPVIASDWSGQKDFLTGEHSILLGGELQQIPQNIVWKDILIPESAWFNINIDQARQSLSYMFSNYMIMKRKAETLMRMNRDKFTLKKMAVQFDKYLDSIFNSFGEQQIKLPKLKKVEKPQKIELPKLKRIVKK